jgi:DNA-binding transcriptional ArsR family regulator
MESTTSYCSHIFRVLGQQTRIDIVEVLRREELCVVDILDAIGKEQSNTSKHLSLMHISGILVNRKAGHRSFYSLKHRDQVLALVDSAKRTRSSDYAETLKLLGQILRMKIVEILLGGETLLSELIRRVGAEQTNTAHHLSLMIAAGIIEHPRKESGRAYYRLSDQGYFIALVDSATKIHDQETLNRKRSLH